ncbi:MAG: stage III sporulation protein AE [Oscillospiraceae bacterium]|jgi:stage III sporulation protein AE|nr:stage III sporulation protein AE [Oscillospiraceae bacterium]
MTRRIFALLLLALALSPAISLAGEPEESAAASEPVTAEALQTQAQNLLNSYDLSDWQATAELLLGERENINVRQLVLSFLRGEKTIDGRTVLERILQIAMQALRSSANLVAQLIVPALICGILVRMRAAFERDTVSEVCRYVAYLLVALIAVRHFFEQLTSVRAVVNSMAAGMQALFPLLLTLLAAVGGTSSSAFFQPAIVAASGTMTALVRNVTLSFALATALVTVLTHISPQIGLTRLRSLLKTIANWSLGICFTVFIGVMTVQGMGAAALDGVTLRTAKYAIDNFVPIVGGMFADTMDTLIACSLLVKNALGATGLVILVGACLAPMTRILIASAIFRFCAAVTEPIADEGVVNLLGDFAGVLTMLFTVLLSVAAMFFLLIAQLLLVGNLTVMLR